MWKSSREEGVHQLDALEPQLLADLVEKYIKAQVDEDAWEQRRREIGRIRFKLKLTADKFV